MSCLSQKEDPPSPAASSNAMLLADLRRGWARPYTHSAFLKDLPRLVRRVRVETCDGVTHGPCGESESEGGGGGVGKAEAVLRLLEVVSAQLRVEETAVRALRLRLDRGDLAGDTASEEQVIARIFEGLESDGPIIKALKLINQGTVLAAMSVLKEEVLRDLMTKDVRTPEGWQIVLRLGDVIQLEHLRTEQSLDEFGDKTNHFELQWMVLATFDRALDQLRSCSVRLLRLSCAETMEPERLSTLRNSLIEGLIVV